jgi:transcriptional regulator with XRE-family HTH domain
MSEDTRGTASEAQRSAQGAATIAVVGNLLSLRRARHWSAEVVAERMRTLGYSWHQNTVSKLENGYRASISVDEFVALAAIFEVAPEKLLNGIPTSPTIDERLSRLEAAVFGGQA